MIQSHYKLNFQDVNKSKYRTLVHMHMYFLRRWGGGEGGSIIGGGEEAYLRGGFIEDLWYVFFYFLKVPLN